MDKGLTNMGAFSPSGSEERISAHVGVAALERGLALLCVLDVVEGLSLSEAARRATLNKTTAFRLMRSLERNGFVARGEDDRYRLGERLKQLISRRRGARAT